MQIQGIGFKQAHGLRCEIPTPKGSCAGNTPQDKPPPVSPPQPDQEDNNDGNPKGVVRLLLEEHFKGVADVRLRINFFDELAEFKREGLASTAGEKVDGFLASVETIINSHLESEELSEEQSAPVNEQLETLVQTVNQVKDDFLNTDKPILSDLFSNIKSVVESFVDLVIPVLNTTTEIPEDDPAFADGILNEGSPENPADEGNGDTSGVQSASESGSEFQTIAADLRADFMAAFEELMDSLKGMNHLHELHAHEGRGKAYNKFLAILNNLSTAETTGNDSSNGETLDTVA